MQRKPHNQHRERQRKRSCCSPSIWLSSELSDQTRTDLVDEQKVISVHSTLKMTLANSPVQQTNHLNVCSVGGVCVRDPV